MQSVLFFQICINKELHTYIGIFWVYCDVNLKLLPWKNIQKVKQKMRCKNSRFVLVVRMRWTIYFLEKSCQIIVRQKLKTFHGKSCQIIVRQKLKTFHKKSCQIIVRQNFLTIHKNDVDSVSSVTCHLIDHIGHSAWSSDEVNSLSRKFCILLKFV